MCTFCFTDLSPDEFQDTKPNGCQKNSVSIKNEKKIGRSKRETLFHVQRVEWINGFPTITKISAIYLLVSLSSHFRSEETTYNQRTCINRVQIKTAFVYYTQFTTNSTEVRQTTLRVLTDILLYETTVVALLKIMYQIIQRSKAL